ncbi:MAG: hypothetical protein Q4B22_00775 [Eubacteriales bacterium]|nr:hypothetical protein [Eubacteriales bacterium]
MKKKYLKPAVYFEQYSLSANIAGACGAGSNGGGSMGGPAQGDPYSCAWMDNGAVIAYSNQDACGDAYVEDANSVGIWCYNSGGDNVQVFTS